MIERFDLIHVKIKLSFTEKHKNISHLFGNYCDLDFAHGLK